ncbi:hypothetical protein [Spartinivicinus poritis]|uniref:Uncharacterized protein n=1 Tax=Spartinivicinus poritis TaxID=2994640 RepID=A0ABT5UB13_9GAMM|nr:hypothetical protein [Spartinivicinus sp. A2-2]MDE1463552.1 hypothetical protein [Spartinivicinus sp. A2-2]
MNDDQKLQRIYDSIRKTGYALAGGLQDLPQRASVYYHLYEDSGYRNVFPLIAAHGALWASGYFAKGMKIGKVLSIQYLFSRQQRHAQYSSLQQFADAFRDINRRVCAEAYTVYHFTKDYGHTAFASSFIAEPLLSILNQCHLANKNNLYFSAELRRKLFEAFFLWEQETIVAPSVESAMRKFDWRIIKWLAMKPCIKFAYFNKEHNLQFVDFASKFERIEKGLSAYETAELVGLEIVETALKKYCIMPDNFFRNTSKYFYDIKASACI